MKAFTLSSFILGLMLVNLAAQPAMPTQITGTVRDTNGVPVAGLEVKAFFGGVESAKTDTNGHFQFRAANPFNLNTGQNYTPFLFVRDVERNLAVARDVEDGTNSYDLQLAPGIAISGRVQNEQGKPVTNAVITVYVWGGNSGWGIQNDNAAKFDAEGRFEVTALPVGRRYSTHVSAKGYSSGSFGPREPNGNRLEVPPFTLKVADQKIAGIVLDPEEQPVKEANVYIYGQGQPNTTIVTDEKGRFATEVCEGIVSINASKWGSVSIYGNARVQSGDTNIVIMLSRQGTGSQPQRPSLVGKPLPDLTFAGLPSDALQTNKPRLICLFDPEQRPSRRLIRLLGEQDNSLKQKGVTVVGISAALITADALKAWKESNPAPFAVGGVTEKNDKTRWILKTEKLPWLILTDTQGRVKAEGFDLDELDAKLK